MLSAVKRLLGSRTMRTHKEINILMLGTFDTELGRKTLEHLAEVFIDRDMYQQGMTLEEVAFRQGEASVIKKIIKEINNGRPTVTDSSE